MKSEFKEKINRYKSTIQKQKKQIRLLEEELKQLKNSTPIKEDVKPKPVKSNPYSCTDRDRSKSKKAWREEVNKQLYGGKDEK